MSPKKQPRKKVKKIILGSVIFCIFIFVSYIGFHALKPRNASTTPYKIVSLSEKQAQVLITRKKEQGEFYPTIEEALKLDEAKEGMKLSKEIHVFSGDDIEVHVVLGKERGTRYVNHYAVLKENGKVSGAIKRDYIHIDKEYKGFGFNLQYTQTDVVGWSVIDSILQENIFSYANNGNPLYYGVSKEKDIRNLWIMGQSPSNIIPFEFDGKTYYYWYYDNLNLTKELTGKMNFSDFTLNEMAELLDIKFIDD